MNKINSKVGEDSQVNNTANESKISVKTKNNVANVIIDKGIDEDSPEWEKLRVESAKFWEAKKYFESAKLWEENEFLSMAEIMYLEAGEAIDKDIWANSQKQKEAVKCYKGEIRILKLLGKIDKISEIEKKLKQTIKSSILQEHTEKPICPEINNILERISSLKEKGKFYNVEILKAELANIGLDFVIDKVTKKSDKNIGLYIEVFGTIEGWAAGALFDKTQEISVQFIIKEDEVYFEVYASNKLSMEIITRYLPKVFGQPTKSDGVREKNINYAKWLAKA